MQNQPSQRTAPIRSISEESYPLLRAISAACTIYGVRYLLGSPTLHEITRQDLMALLGALVTSPEAMSELGQRSYQHANGFWKVPLLDTVAGLRIRLHYWPGGLRAEENIHAHRWYMVSAILLGCLESERFVACSSSSPRADLLGCYRYSKDRNGIMGAEQAFLGHQAVRCIGSDVRVVGDVYAMEPGQLHRITRQDERPTLTLMVQSAAVSRSNLMYTRDAVGEPEVASRPAGAHRLRCLFNEIQHVCKEVA